MNNNASINSILCTGSEIELEFRPEYIPLIALGTKVMTARRNKKGEVGDYFLLDGKKYVLVEVRERTLYSVANLFHKDEGFESAEDFRKEWDLCYPDFRFNPYQTVWTHRWG